jgi:pyruvate formate lyase activating enzyme
MMFGGFEKITLIDYPGKVACMAYTIGCNFRCPYCHNPELVDETVETKLGEDAVLGFLDTRRGMLDGIVITGGEPTIHDDLPAFVEQVKAAGFLVKLDSNGTRPAMLADLIRRRLVDYIAMDVKAPLARYSEIVSRPVDVDAIRESIRLLMAASIEYEFRTTVIKSMLSLEAVEAIGREIEGAKRYYLQRFVPTKLLNPQFRRATVYTDAEFENLRDRLSSYVQFCGIR